jgi:hypothetical protein
MRATRRAAAASSLVPLCVLNGGGWLNRGEAVGRAAAGHGGFGCPAPGPKPAPKPHPTPPHPQLSPDSTLEACDLIGQVWMG